MRMEDEAENIRKLFDEAKELGDTRAYLTALERAIEFRHRARRALDTLLPVVDYTYGPCGDVKYQRGLSDGRRGHPPAELTIDYLRGYAVGQDDKR